MAGSTTYNVVSLYTPALRVRQQRRRRERRAQHRLPHLRRGGLGRASPSTRILYEYNDATGIVGAAKGQYTSASIPTTVAGNRTSLTGVNFGNAAFTVAAGNRLKVMYQIVTGATGGQDVGLLFGSTQSTTNGIMYVTPTLSATT